MKERCYKFDNIKLVVIFFVIMAHFLELFKYQYASFEKMYLVLMTFIMPVFIFISGVFAKFNRKKIFILVFTYALFQVLYRLFDLYLFSPNTEFRFNYVVPYWLLWYIFTITLYTFIVPLLDTKKKTDKIIITTIIITLSLIVNKADNIGYYASISRFFTFLPYFVLGFYAKDFLQKIEIALNKTKIRFSLTLVFTLVVAVSINYILNTNQVTDHMVYGSYSYNNACYNPLIKSMFFVMALAWIGFFYLIIPNKRIPFITVLGSNTLTIYLFHGFHVMYLKKLKYFAFMPETNLLISIGFALLIILIYGNKYVAKFLKFVFCGGLFVWTYDKLLNKPTNNTNQS